jgi:group I intron endonuclease
MDTQNNYTLYMHIFPNGKVYVGITSIKTWERWSGGHGYSGQPLMHRAIMKYGWKNIRHIVLADGMTREEAETAERETIKKFRSNNRRFGYNIANGGSAAGKHTEETKAKMSAAKSGENNPFYGRQLSQDHKQKIRDTRKERGIEPVNKQRVRCLETGIIYESTAQATRETGIHNYAIRRVCYGERKTAGGYHWEYISP